jgi:replicative DNA helicase
MRIETMILKSLVHDEDYLRKALPFIKSEYFSDSGERNVYKVIDEFVQKYNTRPTRDALAVIISDQRGLSESDYKRSTEIVESLSEYSSPERDWLIDETEKFCQERAIYNAIMESISIIDGKSKTNDKGSIPKILQDALAVSMDAHIGHDFIEDADSRFEYYHRVEERVPFDIDLLNAITNGGLPRKTLNVILAGTGVGKTLAMSHMAAAAMVDGKNPLYITMEMAEERIAERIDANLLNIPLDDLKIIPKESYDKKIAKLRARTAGKIVIKEYPTAGAHVGHFRHLLNELHLKKNFRPDIIFVDYINICMSSRIKPGSNVNTYQYVKAIAEELRGLGVEYNLPIVTATQTTRSGFSNSDLELGDTSESFGLPATADFMFALITNENLEALGQLLVKQLKNRYGDPVINKKFVVGVDRPKMRLYNVEQSAQTDIHEGPVMDRTGFGERQREDDSMKWATKKLGRKDFSGLRVS